MVPLNSEKSPRRIFSVNTETIEVPCDSSRTPSYAIMKNVLLCPL